MLEVFHGKKKFNQIFKKKECSIPLLMDELRIYNRPLEDYEIEAEAEPALGGIEPSYI
jgi:hypothetical protein